MDFIKIKQVGKIKDTNGNITIKKQGVNEWKFIRIGQPSLSGLQEDIIDIEYKNIKKLITILKKIK